MIQDSIDNASRYAMLHPLFARAFEQLKRADLLRLPVGRHEVDGDSLYLVLIRSDGRAPARPVLETHRRYIDIHCTLTGSDVIGWKPLRSCSAPSTPYSEEKDVAFYPDKPDFWSVVHAGMFMVCYPGDAHAPLAGDEPVDKVVVKVLLETERD
jgi:biofilm protein TabA